MCTMRDEVVGCWMRAKRDLGSGIAVSGLEKDTNHGGLGGHALLFPLQIVPRAVYNATL